ncbi:MAG: 30S ribosomal protein S14, partial [Acetobacteraceae bacterium]
MAKLSQINRNQKRIRMSARDSAKRAALKKLVMDRKAAVEQRFEASIRLAQLPRNAAKVRIR